MKAIKTAGGVAAARAMMMSYPKEKRLFEDPYSEKLLPLVYKFFIWLMRNPKIRDSIMKNKEKSFPGTLGWFFCRDRYVDDILTNCLEKNEVETAVNLGAGMDCRAYYIPEIEKLLYFEVDHPKVIKKKMKKMKKIFLIEDIGSVEMQERYSNSVDLDLLKTVKEFNIERFVLAEVKR